jgi:hypothetical protein
MSSRHLGSRNDGERSRAIDRLRAAVAERGRAHQASEAAAGSKNDIAASVSLHVATDEVAARKRWLKSVKDQEY